MSTEATCDTRPDIVKGGLATFRIELKKDGQAWPSLSTAFDIQVKFPGDTSVVSVSLADTEISVLASAPADPISLIEVTVSAAKSALMKEGDEQDIDVHVIATNGADPEIVKIEGAVDVLPAVS